MDATPATETVREPASDIPVAGSADVVTRATPSTSGRQKPNSYQFSSFPIPRVPGTSLFAGFDPPDCGMAGRWLPRPVNNRGESSGTTF